jgi:hypothetical protein
MQIRATIGGLGTVSLFVEAAQGAA